MYLQVKANLGLSIASTMASAAAIVITIYGAVRDYDDNIIKVCQFMCCYVK